MNNNLTKSTSPYFITAIIISLFIVSYPANALPEQQLVPGGIAILKLPNYDQDTKVFFNKKRVAVFPFKDAANNNSWAAMAGIGLASKPGDYEFSIRRADGLSVNTKITVASKKICGTASHHQKQTQS